MLLCLTLLLAWQIMLSAAMAEEVHLVIDKGHTASIWTVCFSPDGTKVASGSNDGAKVWDVATATEICSCAPGGGNNGFTRSVSFSPDGSKLVVGTDCEILMFDATNGKCLRKLASESGQKLVFCASGKQLLYVGYGVCKVIDLSTGKVVHTLKNCYETTLSPNGEFVASCGGPTGLFYSGDGKMPKTPPRQDARPVSDCKITIWDVSTGKVGRTLSGHTGTVNACAFSRDGRRLASSSCDGTIRLWDLRTGKELKRFAGMKSTSESLESLALSPDDKRLAWGGADGKITIWDLNTGARDCQISGHSGNITSLAFDATGDRIVSGSAGRKILISGAKDGRLVESLSGHSEPVVDVAFTNDGRVMLSRSQDGNLDSVREWQLSTSEMRNRGTVTRCQFSQGGRAVAVLERNHIVLLDTFTSKRLAEMPTSMYDVRECVVSADNKRICAVVGGLVPFNGNWPYRNIQQVVYWNLQGEEHSALGAYPPLIPGKETLMCKFEDNDTMRLVNIALSPDNKVLAVSNHHYEQQSITLWNLDTGQKLMTLNGSGYITFSPDGKMLASNGDLLGSDDTKIWDLSSGKLVRILEPQSKPQAKAMGAPQLLSCAFSPDGKQMAVGRADSVEVWDVISGQRVFCVSEQGLSCNSLCYSPNGDVFVGGGEDGTIRVWSTKNWKLVGTLIPLDKEDWAVVDPQGRFDASLKGMSLMHLKVGREIVDLTQLKQRFYDPGLLTKLFGFGSEPLRPISPSLEGPF